MSKHQGHTKHARFPSANIPAPDMNMAASDAQGRALLAGLVGFIRPYVDAYATATGMTHSRQLVREDFDSRAERVCNGAQGHELLSALGKFVKDLTEPDGNNTAKATLELATSRDKFMQDRVTIPIQQQSLIAKPMATDNLSQTIVNQVHQHVSNKMPIRMLAFKFDPNGMQIRLVNRGEIVAQIKSRISEKKWERLSESESFNLVRELGRYAILSHTWFRGKLGDVVYSDWKDRELNPEGNNKIVKFCEVAARRHGVVYGWMDTVCIDKSSSTELDESIRSMYRWYRQSHVCITYLADTSEIPDMHRDTWFTRGWTLQELLAPKNMAFYNKNWTFLAQNNESMSTRSSHDVSSFSFKTFPHETRSQISLATSIKGEELAMCFDDPELLPISRVFQLACRRAVTREEDRVYSLMGLLGTSISVAYGEGLPAAFKRLVREMMGTKDNFLDIFNHDPEAHQFIPNSITQYEKRSPLFDRTSSYESTELHNFRSIEPISMTHLGVHVPILLIPLFNKNTFQARIPSRTYPCSISPLASRNSDYLLLGQNDTSAEFFANYSDAGKWFGDNFAYELIFIGILNFWKSGPAYQTLDRWLYVPFNLIIRHRLCRVPDIDVQDLNQMSGPLVLSWSREHPSGYEKIQEQDLRKMGMQVTTLYLK